MIAAVAARLVAAEPAGRGGPGASLSLNVHDTGAGGFASPSAPSTTAGEKSRSQSSMVMVEAVVAAVVTWAVAVVAAGSPLMVNVNGAGEAARPEKEKYPASFPSW